MADDVPPNAGPTWMTYPELADRLGLPTAAAAAARARRAKWPKRLRNDTGQAEVEVPADALPAARKRPPDARPPRRPNDAQTSELRDAQGELTLAKADAAAAKARADTLATQVEREVADRRTLQGQADALRDQLASVQLEAAQATGAANTERAKREAAEARAAELQRQVEALEARQRRRWWQF